MKPTARALLALMIPVALAASTCPAQDNRTLAVYDVRDILATAQDFPMRRFNSGDPHATPDEATARASAHDRFVVDLKRHLDQAGVAQGEFSIQSPHRDGAAPRSIGGQSIEGMLIVNAAPAAHRVIMAYLTQRRTLAKAIIHVEARVFRVRDPKRDLPQPLGDEPIGKQDLLFMLTAEQAKGMVRDLGARANKKSSGVSLLTAPRLSVFHGQRANVTICNQQAYIADFTLVKLLGGKNVVADPVVKTIEVGMGIETRVEVAPDKPSRGRIEIAYQNAELARPIEEKKLEHGTIQLPKVTSIHLDFTVHLPLPGNLLLASRERPGRGVDLVLLHFERHQQGDLRTKRRAAVRAIGPVIRDAEGTHRCFYLGGGKASGLAAGMGIRLMRKGDIDRPSLVATGIVIRAYDDTSAIRVAVAKDAPPVAVDDLVHWWAEWDASATDAKATANPKQL